MIAQNDEVIRLRISIEERRRCGDFQLMLQNAESLVSLVECDELRIADHAYALSACVDALRMMNRSEEAIARAPIALEFSRIHGVTDQEAVCLNAMGNAQLSLGQLESALANFEKAVELEESLGHSERVAGCLHNMAMCIRRNDPEKSLELLFTALSKIPTETNTPFKGVIHRSIAEAYLSLHDYTVALNHTYQALEFFEKHNYDYMLLGLRNLIGLVHYELQELDKAEVIFLDTLEQIKDQAQSPFRRQALVMLGHICSAKDQLDEAVSYYHRSLELTDELDSASRANILNGIAGVEFARNNIFVAEEIFREVLSLFQKDRFDISAEAIARLMIARCAMKRNANEEALDLLTTSLSIVQQTKAKPVELSIRTSLDEFYCSQGLYAEAYSNMKASHTLQEELREDKARELILQKEQEVEELKRNREAALTQQRESILNNVLPAKVTARLIKGENPIADSFDNVSILFMDIVDFTRISKLVSARQLVHLLNIVFTEADLVSSKHGLEKIKTIGDAYMAVAGAPVILGDHALRAVNTALDLLDSMKSLALSIPDEIRCHLSEAGVDELQVRFGLHCGPAAAGVVGRNKLHYDLWGDTVNTASRMESHGEAGRIHVSSDFVRELHKSASHQRDSFRIIERGVLEVKGQGRMLTYFIERV